MTVMAILGMFLLGGLAGFNTVEGKAVMAGAGLEALVGIGRRVVPVNAGIAQAGLSEVREGQTRLKDHKR